MNSYMLMTDWSIIISTVIFSITLITITRLRLRCLHKYEVIKEVKIVTTNSRGAESVTGFQYISRCTKCGKLKEDTV